jgi:NAD(P)-dependent dehydrogenase (short-subunit alcohol dehydrogenase family)
MDALTRSMSLDLAPYGIRVNAVAPGATLSRPITPDRQAFRDQQAQGIPLGRLGTCEEIGAAVAFLASDAAAYMTGQIIYVDGGLTAQLSPPGMFI